MRPLVVAVSGISGAGKTELIASLAVRMPHSACLSFDADDPGFRAPRDLGDWVRRGADPEEFVTPRMVESLVEMCESGTGPNGPVQTVLVEEPFGRARPSVASFFDLVLCLETPLETAFARRLGRYFARDDGRLARNDPGRLIRILDDEIRGYLFAGEREVQRATQELARLAADAVLDGSRPADAVCAEALRFLARLDSGTRS